MRRIQLLIATCVLSACAEDFRPEDQAASSATMGPSASSGTAATSGTTGTAETTSTGSESTGSSGEAAESSSSETGESTGEPETGEPEIDWPETPCVEDNDGAYVLGRTATLGTELHHYDPQAGTFALAFEMACLDAYALDGPVSLAVGRDGQALLSGADPEVVLTFPVVGTDEPCAEMSAQRWSVPGGYASIAFQAVGLFDADTERLFAHGGGTQLAGWFGEVFHFAEGFPVSIFDSANRAYSDLAGTGDGQLFGVAYSGQFVSLLSPHWGGEAILGSPEVDNQEFFAWGGALWLFDGQTQKKGEGTAGLYRFALDGTEAYDLVTPASEFPVSVLSATTSTCAPTVFGG